MLRGSRAITGGEGRIEQKCKVDYEKLIKKSKEQLDKTVRLKTALLEYIDYPPEVSGPLAEMIGELFIEERYFSKRIDDLIKEQEEQEAQT